MPNISKIWSLSLWVFIIPLITINACLIVVTVFQQYVPHGVGIGPTFPYFDGGVSISRTARTYPTYLIFKPSMIFASVLLILYWVKTNKIINTYQNLEGKTNLFRTFGILSAVFLIIHSIFLGIKFDYDLYKLFRRFVLLGFIIFEIVAQSLLVYRFFKLKTLILKDINNYVLILKIILVTILVIVAVTSFPIVVSSGNTHFKHALEWNYFVGVITFYLLTFLFWKKE